MTHAEAMPSTRLRASNTSQNPYVFVVGCQRSGTTMLQRMLDAHPVLTVAYDSLFIPRPIKDLRIGENPTLTPEIIRAVREHPRFPRLGVPEEGIERACAGSRTYRDFIGALYDELARHRGKPLAGEKSPGYCRHLTRLHALLPSVRTIHLIRDGRDVALSIRDWGKGAAKLDLSRREPIAAAALWWRRDVREGCEQGRRLAGASYTEVRYESLVSDPETGLRAICSFLALEYSPSMAEYHKGKEKSTPGISPKAAWAPPTQGLRDWRTQLTPRDQELFEAIAGEQLERLGYERRFARISASIQGIASECESAWNQEMDLS